MWSVHWNSTVLLSKKLYLVWTTVWLGFPGNS
uniref:Uncharacterized protein n=1 Tax=Anguilla anguilla TaxID=7936 RepID=A0A0E9TBB6_ANGAN